MHSRLIVGRNEDMMMMMTCCHKDYGFLITCPLVELLDVRKTPLSVAQPRRLWKRRPMNRRLDLFSRRLQSSPVEKWRPAVRYSDGAKAML